MVGVHLQVGGRSAMELADRTDSACIQVLLPALSYRFRIRTAVDPALSVDGWDAMRLADRTRFYLHSAIRYSCPPSGTAFESVDPALSGHQKQNCFRLTQLRRSDLVHLMHDLIPPAPCVHD